MKEYIKSRTLQSTCLLWQCTALLKTPLRIGSLQDANLLQRVQIPMNGTNGAIRDVISDAFRLSTPQLAIYGWRALEVYALKSSTASHMLRPARDGDMDSVSYDTLLQYSPLLTVFHNLS